MMVSKPALIDKVVRMLPVVIEQMDKKVKPETAQKIVAVMEQVKEKAAENIIVRVAVDKAVQQVTQMSSSKPQTLSSKQAQSTKAEGLKPEIIGKQMPVDGLTKPVQLSAGPEIVRIDVDEIISRQVSVIADEALSIILDRRMDPKQAAEFLKNFKEDVVARVLSMLEDGDAAAVLAQPGLTADPKLLKEINKRLKAVRGKDDEGSSPKDREEEAVAAIQPASFADSDQRGDGKEKKKYDLKEMEDILIDRHSRKNGFML